MYPVAFHKIPSKTLDSSQVLGRLFLQKQQNIVNKEPKGWDKRSIRDLEKVYPKHTHGFLF